MEVGLVLSGGGARGIAHLGVMKALEEAGITFSVISATSAGAMAGALYAHGYSIAEILNIIKTIKPFRFLKPALSLKGFLTMGSMQSFFRKHLPHNSFEALKIPLHVAATNIRTGKTDYFTGGDLTGALCASSCIPVLFDPVKYNDEFYLDGGILNNLPVEPLKGQNKVIIGCHANPIDPDFNATNARLVMERALLLAISCNAYNRRDDCDFFIEPHGLEKYRVLDLANMDQLYKIGYEQAVQQIKVLRIKEKLQDEL